MPASAPSMDRLRKLPWHLRYRVGAGVASDLRRVMVLATHRHCRVEFRGPVRLGPGFSLWIPDRGTLIVGSGVEFRRGVVCEISGEGRVTIGDGSIFTGGNFIQCSTSVDIGEGCVFAQATMVVDGSHRFGDASRHSLEQGYDYRALEDRERCDGHVEEHRLRRHRRRGVHRRTLGRLAARAGPLSRHRRTRRSRVALRGARCRPAVTGRARRVTVVPARLTAADVAVVIPTRDRWEILDRTLRGLRAQTVSGFETVIVSDGLDQRPPKELGSRVVVKEQGGPAAARNAGVHATDRSIVLFLGDDMVPAPDLVARHLARHNGSPGDEVAVLGHADWHPDVAGGRVARWLEWSASQFDYRTIAGPEAGFGRFYSCNVSLKRQFLLEVGGFDESFAYCYEDLDLGFRLGQKGMRLLYEPGARTEHLHRYDLTALERRFRAIGEGEHVMARTHPWFSPFFLARVRHAVAEPPRGLWWPLVVDRVPRGAGSLRRRVERRADSWYHQHLAGPFLSGWAAEADRAELEDYLGSRYDPRRLVAHQHEVDSERNAAPDEDTFYRTSEAYLYDLTAFAMSGTKAPYLAELCSAVPPGSRVLDYGCGIGADGLRLAAAGYDVAFSEFDNPSAAFLRWRLERRRLACPVYDLDVDDAPSGFDVAFSFDVIEHVEDPFAFLAALERRARLVMVNFLEEDPADTDLHRPLPIAALLDHAERSGIERYRLYHGRSHLVVYRSPALRGEGRRPSALRSTFERRAGAWLPRRRGWYPMPSA